MVRLDNLINAALANGLVAVSVVTDFIGAGFPVVLLWKVDIPLRRKVALCLLMGLGIMYI